MIGRASLCQTFAWEATSSTGAQSMGELGGTSQQCQENFVFKELTKRPSKFFLEFLRLLEGTSQIPDKID